jgi:Cdc6-like AAA superfamily ATPase
LQFYIADSDCTVAVVCGAIRRTLKDREPTLVKIFPTFSTIEIGEPDANVEWYNAKRRGATPIFIDTFLALPHFPWAEFEEGNKFLIFGQKGTGKTAAIRYLETKMASRSETEVIVFKKTFNEEADLHQFSKIPLMVDEENVVRYRHYLHAVKRILIFIFLKKSFENSETISEEEKSNDIINKIKNSTMGDIITFGFDSIKSLIFNAGINLKELTNNSVLIDVGRAIKSNNDDLLNMLIKRVKRENKKISLFLDEIHFAYRSEEALQQDAMLVRDTILALNNLNDRFAEEGVDLRIYAAVRSEYLEHPIISSADVNHTVESIGFYLGWSTFPYDEDHPLFQLVFDRFKRTIGQDFSFDDFMRIYMKEMDARDFLSRTWAKPRDFIRFFKCVKEMYGNKFMLKKSEWNAVWRQYSQLSWNEIKSSASPFMNSASIAELEAKFREIVPDIIDKHLSMKFPEFSEHFKKIYESAKGANSNFYSFSHFMDLIYILGIFGTMRDNAVGSPMVQSYHRGNRSFHRDGKVLIHPAVLKAFG